MGAAGRGCRDGSKAFSSVVPPRSSPAIYQLVIFSSARGSAKGEVLAEAFMAPAPSSLYKQSLQFKRVTSPSFGRVLRGTKGLWR